MANTLTYLTESNSNQGPFTRYNEPLVFTPIHEVQRYWEYDQLKYKNKRDPSFAELESSLQSFSPALYKELAPLINKIRDGDRDILANECCKSHCLARNILARDHRNVDREVNKLILNTFVQEFGLK